VEFVGRKRIRQAAEVIFENRGNTGNIAASFPVEKVDVIILTTLE
jgi:hypothetical protein